MLLFYGGQGLEPVQVEALERMARRLKTDQRLRCRVIVLCSPGAKISDIAGVTTVTDSASEFAAANAPAVSTGYMIRPDGYVEYHARTITDRGLFEYLAALA